MRIFSFCTAGCVLFSGLPVSLPASLQSNRFVWSIFFKTLVFRVFVFQVVHPLLNLCIYPVLRKDQNDGCYVSFAPFRPTIRGVVGLVGFFMDPREVACTSLIKIPNLSKFQTCFTSGCLSVRTTRKEPFQVLVFHLLQARDDRPPYDPVTCPTWCTGPQLAVPIGKATSNSKRIRVSPFVKTHYVCSLLHRHEHVQTDLDCDIYCHKEVNFISHGTIFKPA